MKELLSHELSPTLFAALFDQIRIYTDRFFDSHAQVVRRLIWTTLIWFCSGCPDDGQYGVYGAFDLYYEEYFARMLPRHVESNEGSETSWNWMYRTDSPHSVSIHTIFGYQRPYDDHKRQIVPTDRSSKYFFIPSKVAHIFYF